MRFIIALIFSVMGLLPSMVFAADVVPLQDPANDHSVLKCNFTNEQAEPKLFSVIADPEWLQIVYLTRDGQVVPQVQDVVLRIDLVSSSPVAYNWNFINKAGKPYLQIQELVTDPSRFAIIGKKPGTYDCYRQNSSMIDYYKRF